MTENAPKSDQDKSKADDKSGDTKQTPEQPKVQPTPPTSVKVEPAQPEGDVSTPVEADDPRGPGTLIGGKIYDVSPENGHVLRES